MAHATPTKTAPVVLLTLTVQTFLAVGNFLAAKRGLQEITPLTFVPVRLALGGVAFALLMLVARLRMPPRALVARVLVLGLLVGPLNQGLLFTGLATAPAAHAGILYALSPVGVYFLALSRGQETASLVRWLGIGLALAGALVLIVGRSAGIGGLFTGDLYILVAVCAWCLWMVEVKNLAPRYGALSVVSWSFVAAGLWVLPLLPWANAPAIAAASSTALWCFAYTVVIGTLLSHALLALGLGRTDASLVAIFANVQPVSTAVLAWLWLGDPLGAEVYLGGALVLVGLRLTQRPRRQSPPDAPSLGSTS